MTNRTVSYLAFTVLALLWLAFALALIINSQLLDSTWATFRSWPLIVQLAAGLLFLPVVAGLWIWETSWPVLLRLVLVAGLAWATLYTFNPWKAGNTRSLSKETA